MVRVCFDRAKTSRFAGFSYLSLECLRAAELLAQVGVDAEVVDLRSLTPIDMDTLGASVGKTGRLIAADTAHKLFGATAEVISRTVENNFADLKAAPVRVGLPDMPTPTTPALADHFYPGPRDIAQAALDMLGSTRELPPEEADPRPLEGRAGYELHGPLLETGKRLIVNASPQDRTQTAFVLGASADIGVAISERLLGEGWAVVGAARDTGRLEKLAQHDRFTALHCDLAESASIREMVERFAALGGTWDLFVSAAGTMEPIGRFFELDFERLGALGHRQHYGAASRAARSVAAPEP